jgi:hypothetical protein
MKKLISTNIFFIFVLYLVAQAEEATQTQAIHGSVVDAITGFPLPGAHIILLDSEPLQAATTDLNGLSLLENVPLGRQSIQMSYVGYNSRVYNNLTLLSGRQKRGARLGKKL